jgi:hypothetical protein
MLAYALEVWIGIGNNVVIYFNYATKQFNPNFVAASDAQTKARGAKKMDLLSSYAIVTAVKK